MSINWCMLMTNLVSFKSYLCQGAVYNFINSMNEESIISI